MYSKIAFSNVKKSIRDYTIYFLTLTFGICLFYMFNSVQAQQAVCLLYTSPSPRDTERARMPSSA